MKFLIAAMCICVLVLSSCYTMAPQSYQSSAPEARGERAISSDIELVKEVELQARTLGVFYSHEVYQSGNAQLLLFALRGAVMTGQGVATGQGTMDDYSLSRTASLTIEQAKEFMSAIDNYLATDTKAVAPTKMLNFELYSGILDLTVGNETYRPFRDLTFIVICSITNTRKSFRTVFPETTPGLYGQQSTYYQTFDLTTEQVQSLRQAISDALNRSTPPAAPKDSNSGT